MIFKAVFIPFCVFLSTLSTASPNTIDPSQSFKNLSIGFHALDKVLESVSNKGYAEMCTLVTEAQNIVTISTEDEQFPKVTVEAAKQNVKDICNWVC